MNAETRAKELTNAMSKKLHVRVSTEQWNGMWELSREAIRQAENDKLEEAARDLQIRFVLNAEETDTAWLQGVEFARHRIRSLIKKD